MSNTIILRCFLFTLCSNLISVHGFSNTKKVYKSEYQNLFNVKEKKEAREPAVVKTPKVKTVKKYSKKRPVTEPGNLKPSERRHSPSTNLNTRGFLGKSIVPNVATSPDYNLKPGQSVDIYTQNLHGISDSKNSNTLKLPITAEMITGPFAGGTLVGFTTLDRRTKTLDVSFNSMTNLEGEVFKINAKASTLLDRFDIPVKVKGRRSSLFFLDFLTAFSSAFFKTRVSTQKTTNIFGTQTESIGSTVSNSINAATAETLDSLGKTIRNEIINAKYVGLSKGPHNLRVHFLTTPKLL